MQPIEDIVKQHAPLNRSTASKRKSMNSILKPKTQRNERIYEFQSTPIPCEIHLQPQGSPRRKTGRVCSSRPSWFRPIPANCTLRSREVSHRQLRYTPSAFTYKEYTNGVSLESKDPTFSTAIAALTSTERILNLPDNVLLLCYVTTDKGNDFLIEHLSNFIRFLMKLGRTHQIQHLAIAFSKDIDEFPNAVKTADVSCIRLY